MKKRGSKFKVSKNSPKFKEKDKENEKDES